MDRGAEWLFRMNTVKGRFLPGFLPSVNAVMEGDNYLRQAGAALALARAARQTGNKAYAARATQAVLALLDDTETQDDNGTTLRRHLATADLVVPTGWARPACSSRPSTNCRRRRTICLKKSEELCAYMRKQQRIRRQPDLDRRGRQGDGRRPRRASTSIPAWPCTA